MGIASIPSSNNCPDLVIAHGPRSRSYTECMRNPAVLTMCALALNLLDDLDWRHHGIGVLQGYVVENGAPEVRLHVWSRQLLKPGMDVSGDAHDHRFDMLSHVLVGSIEHEEMIEEADPEGDHAMLALTHARAAAESNYHGPTTPLPGRFRVRRERFTIPAGYSYRFPAGRFHRSPIIGGPDDVAVTCIEKHAQVDSQARLLHPIAHEPVMAFGHEPDELLIACVLQIAKDELCRALGEKLERA